MITRTPVAVYVDGYSLGELGFVVEDLIGLLAAPDQAWRTAELLDRPGVVLLDEEPSVPARDVTVTGMLRATTRSLLVSNFDALVYRLSAAEVLVRTIDSATRELVCRPLRVRADGSIQAPKLKTRYVPFEMTLTALWPFWRGTTATVVPFTTATAMPLGTAESRPVLTLTAATNPVLTYKDSAGATVTTLTLTATGTIVVDCDTRLITVGGVPTPTALTSGDFPVFDPHDGNWLTSAWPTIATSSGTGSASYRKAYR